MHEHCCISDGMFVGFNVLNYICSHIYLSTDVILNALICISNLYTHLYTYIDKRHCSLVWVEIAIKEGIEDIYDFYTFLAIKLLWSYHI